jgi:hypothetical protein
MIPGSTTMSAETSSIPIRSLGVSVGFTLLCALIAVVGFIAAAQANVIAGGLIVAASVVFWSLACTMTDLVEFTP